MSSSSPLSADRAAFTFPTGGAATSPIAGISTIPNVGEDLPLPVGTAPSENFPEVDRTGHATTASPRISPDPDDTYEPSGSSRGGLRRYFAECFRSGRL